MSKPLSPDILDLTWLPYRPYCYDADPAESRPRPLSEAIKHHNIQMNPVHAMYWIVVDIDKPIITDPPSPQMIAILDGDLPTPNLLVIHPDKGSAHAYYALARPVAKGFHESLHALRYVAAIEAALIYGYGADAGYAGLVAKNPHSPQWRRLVLRREPYTLHELEDSLDMSGPSKSEMKDEAIRKGEAGRNVAVFDKLRYFAYQHVMMYREDATFEQWSRFLSQKAEQVNLGFRDPIEGLMSYSELRHIVKSVAKWTWNKYSGLLDDRDFSDLQAFRGSIGGRISSKVRMESAGSAEAFSEQMKVVRSHRKSIGKPWEAEGISRATWYRRKKAEK